MPMDFQWAKKAISIAQKRIDAVLDITPEEEEEVDAYGSLSLPSVPEFESIVDEDGNVASKSDWEQKEGDSNGWNAELPNDFSNVSTNSPDEGGCSGDDHEADTPLAPFKGYFGPAEVTLSVSSKGFKSEEVLPQSLSCDDALTVVSSDIEVLRQGDSCSVASSATKKNTSLPISDQDQMSSNASDHVSKEPLPTIESLSGEIAQLRVQIQYQERRNSDLQARNQKLEKRSQEFMALKAACTQHSATETMLIKKLTEKENELASLLQEGEKLAENNGKMSKELKRLKKLLAEQDQLAKKLAQSDVDKELAKEEIRALTAENNKLRVKYFLATVKSMEGESSKGRVTEEVLTADLKRKDEKIEKLMGDLQRAEAGRESAIDESRARIFCFFRLTFIQAFSHFFFTQLEELVQELTSKAEERELSTKGVEEITKGLNAAVEEEKRKNERQACYIDSLEKRLDELMETQRGAAQMVAIGPRKVWDICSKKRMIHCGMIYANTGYFFSLEFEYANQPLLTTIQQLEEELRVKTNDFESSLSQKEKMTNKILEEKNELIAQNREYSAELAKLRTSNSESQQVVVELSSRLRILEENQKRLEVEIDRINDLNRNLKSSLSLKEKEVENFYTRLRTEAENAEKLISEKQSKVVALTRRCEEYESELAKLRENVETTSVRAVSRTSSTVSVANDYDKQPVVSYGSLNAAQAELVEVMTKYEQSMRQVAALKAKVIEMESNAKLLARTRKELQNLRVRYESLLEAHGEKIERIEELELDLEDVKKLFKEQVLRKGTSLLQKRGFFNARRLLFITFSTKSTLFRWNC
ncbi:unnamed protein product [Enterobius vermicularis]|uniref:TMF_TATA_bd domain-containing protein n=1 Tax=Enterobius vermicularis TaxID=51028 RepID=A0A0N4UUH9_ENTVE|nr:unnamed protein product [Enterobius vermicularis]